MQIMTIVLLHTSEVVLVPEKNKRQRQVSGCSAVHFEAALLVWCGNSVVLKLKC